MCAQIDPGRGRSKSPGAGGVESARVAGGQIPPSAIAGFRNIVVHDYLGLDMETIWNVAEGK